MISRRTHLPIHLLESQFYSVFLIEGQCVLGRLLVETGFLFGKFTKLFFL